MLTFSYTKYCLLHCCCRVYYLYHTKWLWSAFIHLYNSFNHQLSLKITFHLIWCLIKRQTYPVFNQWLSQSLQYQRKMRPCNCPMNANIGCATYQFTWGPKTRAQARRWTPFIFRKFLDDHQIMYVELGCVLSGLDFSMYSYWNWLQHTLQ